MVWGRQSDRFALAGHRSTAASGRCVPGLAEPPFVRDLGTPVGKQTMTHAVLSKPMVRSLQRCDIPNADPKGKIGKSQFLSHLTSVAQEIDPLAFLAAGSAVLGGGTFFSQPSQGTTLVGIGAAHVYEAGGPERFRNL